MLSMLFSVPTPSRQQLACNATLLLRVAGVAENAKVCVGMRVMRARPWREFQKKCSHHGLTARISTPCHSIVAPFLFIIYEVARQFRRDTLEKMFEHFKIIATAWHALFHLTCISTHPHAHCHVFFVIGTRNYVPWRKPFVVPVSYASLDYVPLKCHDLARQFPGIA